MKTRQEVFETVCRHLAKQNRRSLVRPATDELAVQCAYRSYDGLMCAVGCLIKDEYYQEDFNSDSAESDSVSEALRLSGIDTESTSIDQLCWLQNIHDNNDHYVNNQNVIAELSALAHFHKLSFRPEEWGLITDGY